MKDNLVPRDFHLLIPKGAREETPWFKLVRCLGDKFMFVGGVAVFQHVAAIVICNIQKRSSFFPGKLGKLFYNWAVELYHICHNNLNI